MTHQPTEFNVSLDGNTEIMKSRGELAEERFLEVCVHAFGLAEVDQKAVGKRLQHDAIVRADEKTDYGKGIDFYVYIAERNKWTPIDLTISTDRNVLDEKKAKEERTGTKVLILNERDLLNSTHENVKVAQEACKNIGRALVAAIKEEK